MTGLGLAHHDPELADVLGGLGEGGVTLAAAGGHQVAEVDQLGDRPRAAPLPRSETPLSRVPMAGPDGGAEASHAGRLVDVAGGGVHERLDRRHRDPRAESP